MWTARFGRGFGTVVRQTANLMDTGCIANVWTVLKFEFCTLKQRKSDLGICQKWAVLGFN
jgi:hypothetical protein